MKIKVYLLFTLSILLSGAVMGQNPCGQGTIIINGQDVDAVMIDGSNRQGLSLPIWLDAGHTVAAGDRVQLVSIIEFNEEPQSGGSGNSLVYNRVITVGTTQQQVPNGKVWKIEGIIKYADPFIAGLSASANSPICFDDNLNLTSSVSGATYAWTGPNGFTSSAQNPTINNADFTNIGTYYLTATHNGCSYSDSVNVTINPQPASTFSNTYAIENYASTFTPTVGGQNYSWTFASGSPTSSNAQNPQVTWNTAGSYQVDLTVTDGNGCHSTTQQNVTVSSCFANDPNSNFSWGSAIANYATNFTANLSGAASYNWSFDNGTPTTSTQQNPSVTWTTAGTYTVTLTVSTGSACYTTTQNVTVSNCLVNQPESDFSWTTPAMANTNITFTPGDMGANIYTWTFDQATPNSSSTQSPNNIQWASGGTYNVTLVTDFSGVGCFTTTKQVTVFSGMHTFTNCGQTGRTGPSQGQCDSEYSGTSLDGLVTVSGGIQEWTVSQTGTYRIEVYGAGNGGGIASGLGAEIYGELLLTQGQLIKILVGQQSVGNYNNNSSGGSGGTFVVTTSNTPLIIAGGGGGGTRSTNPVTVDAATGPNGNNDSGNDASNNGGAAGNGGSSNGNWGGAGGGGLTGDGGIAYNSGSTISNSAGISFVNGGVGGTAGGSYGREGGFGGGGASSWAAGGGGGYSGGAGKYSSGSGNQRPSGGGGGSYIAPSATNVATSDGNYDGSPTFNGNPITNLNSFNSGHGQVIIYY